MDRQRPKSNALHRSSLERLPPELLLRICKSLNNVRSPSWRHYGRALSSLASLCRASKHLHTLGSAVLYQRFRFRIRREEPSLRRLTRFISTTRRSSLLAGHVRELILDIHDADSLGRIYLDGQKTVQKSGGALDSELGSFVRPLPYTISVLQFIIVLEQYLLVRLTQLRKLSVKAHGPCSMHTVGNWVFLERHGRTGSLPSLHTVVIKTLGVPAASQKWGSGILQALCRIAPNITYLDTQLVIPMPTPIDMANATFHLQNIENLDLHGTEVGSEMLSSLVLSCGPLKSFKYRPGAGYVNRWHHQTRETADVTAASILDALKPHANTLKSLELNIMENAFHSGRREQLKSMRHFETLEYLGLDSFCYDKGQSLGKILPGRLETIDIICMHESMHEDVLELARSAEWISNLNTVTLYPWPNSTICPTSILKISAIANQFRQRNVVFSFSHGININRASRRDLGCNSFLDRLALWNPRTYNTLA